MRLLSCGAMAILFLLISVSMFSDKSSELQNRLTLPVAKNAKRSIPACMTESDVADALRRLANSDATAEQQAIAATLRDNASQSGECRRQAVTPLIATLDKTDRDLLLNRSSFFLWHYGSKLLAELKAVEALDLLIANFDLHDGTPFPFDHHPAIMAAAHIGEEAIPALKSTLYGSSDDSTRRYAVFCLAEIGGKVAKQVLHERLVSESNCCVSNCIRASLEAFENKTFPNHITSEHRTKWYTTFMCDCDSALRIKIWTN
ncbi:MAG TPA: hypothetical protein VFM05_01635 [Candidatus Saccharimonadales bacterium]|nr:hypothetical protein [Candidatus Saccharimonadales bacterium]